MKHWLVRIAARLYFAFFIVASAVKLILMVLFKR